MPRAKAQGALSMATTAVPYASATSGEAAGTEIIRLLRRMGWRPHISEVVQEGAAARAAIRKETA